MDRYIFCTIITSNYIHFAITLFDSLVTFKKDINFVIGVSDYQYFDHKIEDERISVIDLGAISDISKSGRRIYNQYFPKRMDHFRWSMKPILLKYLLGQGFTKAIYLDSDIFFCNKYDFLIEELDFHNVLLTPHWRPIVPSSKNNEFSRILHDGQYNAGFFAANDKSIEALDWWASACAYECKRDYVKGFHDDQGYLNILPIYFENIKVLEHKGCNIASWNLDYCNRTLNSEGKVLINNKWELIFIHMTQLTIKKIKEGSDPLLLRYLEQWQALLEKNNSLFGSKIIKDTKYRKAFEIIRIIFSKLKRLRIIIED